MSSSLVPFCIVGFMFVVLLQAFFVYKIGRYRNKVAGEKKRCEKIRSAATELAEEVAKVDRGIASNEATIHKLEEEIFSLNKKLKNGDKEGDPEKEKHQEVLVTSEDDSQ